MQEISDMLSQMSASFNKSSKDQSIEIQGPTNHYAN